MAVDPPGRSFFLTVLQLQHRRWVDDFYPNQPAEIPAAGMVEEAGELLHGLLALERAKRWGYEPRNPPERIRGAIADAVGDCFIYFCSYCNTRKWTLSDFDCPVLESAGRSPLAIAVDLVRIAAEFSVTHNRDYACFYVSTLKLIAKLQDLDFQSVVSETWAIVRERKR